MTVWVTFIRDQDDFDDHWRAIAVSSTKEKAIAVGEHDCEQRNTDEAGQTWSSYTYRVEAESLDNYYFKKCSQLVKVLK